MLHSTVRALVYDYEQLSDVAALTGRVSVKLRTRLQRRGREGQSGRHESLLLQRTVERPITLPESSTCIIKCFALKVKSTSTATVS